MQTSLKQIINKVPSERFVFITHSSSLHYGDLLRLINHNTHKIKPLKGKNVVIHGQSRFELAKLLVLLDGEVANILFLPEDIDKKLYERYCHEARIHYDVYLESDSIRYKVINELFSTEPKYCETGWIIPTSGTTSTPKLVSHNLQSLSKTVKRNVDIGKEFTWGLVFDIYRFSGIQVLLQALIGGSTLIILEAEDSVETILESLLLNKCNALSATPSFWRKIMMSRKVAELDLKIITLGGEIADNNILRVLTATFPTAKVSHIYASTEAGVGFSVNDGMSGFPKEYLQGALQHISLKISNHHTLLINNKNHGQKYLSNEKLYDESGFIDTGDIVELKDERVFFLGRDSGAINVGGNKVQPEEVENILLDYDRVKAAHVYAKKNPIMGNIVCADIVIQLDDIDQKKLKVDLLKFCRKRLENFKIPALIKFVDELQTTHSGKLKRG